MHREFAFHEELYDNVDALFMMPFEGLILARILEAISLLQLEWIYIAAYLCKHTFKSVCRVKQETCLGAANLVEEKQHNPENEVSTIDKIDKRY